MDILSRLKDGDSLAFEQVMNEYKRMVFHMAYEMTGDFHDAEDIAQEVFVRVFTGISGFREEASLKTWIMKITINLCRRHHRRKKLLSIFGFSSTERNDSRQESNIKDIPIEYDPYNEIQRKERMRRLREAIQRLPLRQREVFVMKHLKGMKIREIAQVLGCADGTVKANLFKAIDNLRNFCKEKEI